MATEPKSSACFARCLGSFAAVLLLLVIVISALFWRNYLPGHTLFSNDGPLGTLMSESHSMPGMFSGGWQDLNSIGFREGGAWPNVSYGLLWLLGPVGYSKFYAPIALLILGLGAWAFFRHLGLAPLACVLGGVAAALNSGFFSAACWGVAAHPITIGMNFLALAALCDTRSPWRWLKVVLAGLAVGMGVAEGADIGAIFSIFVAIFCIYQAWIQPGPRGSNVGTGVLRVSVVALFAAFLAAQSMLVLVSTQIKGVAGAQQDTQSKEQRWDWATQWSLPKREALGLIVPGLFGYRMDTPQGLPESMKEAYSGGVYWGAAGRDPNWDRYFASGSQGQPPQGFLRFTGGGNYTGILVVLIAVWAAAQALRRNNSVYSLETRRWIWFWSGVAVASLLLAFGKYAPFYQFLYMLPYFSTIRNPAKFTHVFNWAMVILFAYGLNGVWRRYLAEVTPTVTLGRWWQTAKGFDRRWTVISVLAVGASALTWLIYASSSDALVRYLQQVQFDQSLAETISKFSIMAVAWFVVFLAIAVGLLTIILSGKLNGPRAKWGGVLLGLFLVVDLGRANLPWIISWDYANKYATNPILDKLREKPFKQRVAILPGWIGSAVQAPAELGLVEQMYRIEWAQHHFLYYNIQSLDIVQMPRMPEDLMAFESALQPKSMSEVSKLVARRWELTNTRYLIGAAGFVPFLNQQIDPGRNRFRIAEQFEIGPRPGVTRPNRLEDLTAISSTNGNYALIEFTGALPRAKLYSKWQSVTNDQSALQTLTSPSFDPHQVVLVSDVIPPGTNQVNATNGVDGIDFVSYSPKKVLLKAEAKLPSVLLLNDRFDPNWRVLINGKPETLLRCNYIMRGVYLPAGSHSVEFRFEPPVRGLYVSLSAVILGCIIAGVLLVLPNRTDHEGKLSPQSGV